jgi:hypothetical protein
VDEFQNFANESFASILSEARKYRLALTMAHQYIAQMPEEVRDAVFGNVGTMITFRIGGDDAAQFEKEFAPYIEPEDIVNLGIYQIYLKLMINGVTSHPFSAVTLPPLQKGEIIYVDEVLQASRQNFARPRKDVEEKILNYHMYGVESPKDADIKRYEQKKATKVSKEKGKDAGQKGGKMNNRSNSKVSDRKNVDNSKDETFRELVSKTFSEKNKDNPFKKIALPNPNKEKNETPIEKENSKQEGGEYKNQKPVNTKGEGGSAGGENELHRDRDARKEDMDELKNLLRKKDSPGQKHARNNQYSNNQNNKNNKNIKKKNSNDLDKERSGDKNRDTREKKEKNQGLSEELKKIFSS